MLSADDLSKGKNGIDELITPGHIEDRFDIGQVIGQGAYSTVRVATEKGTNKKVAIKYIERRRAFGDMNLDLECRLLRQLGRHPNINAFVGLYENKKCYMIVLEYMKGGELLDILIKRVEQGKTPYSEAQVAVIMRQVVSAVEQCHKNDIIHRDLKPENILVSDEGTLGAADSLFGAPLKVADFGLATVFKPGQKLRETCGTPNYMAPERLCRKPYDEKSDIWSVGVLMYILVAGTFPFYGETDEEIRLCACNPNEPEYGPEFKNVSRPCLELLRDHLLAKDPAKRPTASELLRHPWMTGELASTAEIKGALQQLKRFNARRKFRASVRALVASNRLRLLLGGVRAEALVFELMDYQITTAMIKDLNKVFASKTKGTYLANKDLFVQTLLTELEIPKQALVEELFNGFQKEGTVNTRDFCLSVATKLGNDENQSLELAFEIFDADGSGHIDQKEYAEMITSILKSLGESGKPNELWLQQEFESVDTDKSGQISKKEFVSAAKSNIKIQMYMRNVRKMLQSKDQVFATKMEQKKKSKSGDLFIAKEKGGLFGGGAKERWVVLEGNRVIVYKDEAEMRAKKAPKLTFEAASSTLYTRVESKKRADCKMKLDGGKSVGAYIFETKTPDEAKLWVSILKEAGIKAV
eukprot:comp14772_c0_seq1/m.11192 comp14772_c0_seq1/g.11192  ORF comp14772_c0_seq1/g.11192 comp14772_c0_seq1/m.11192 type:complete len:642 (-) comp14772_c0_seq1:453-2378(-)